MHDFSSQLQEAIKNKDVVTVSVLRMLLSELTTAEIAKRPNPLSEDDVLRIVQKEAKKRKESIEAYKKGGRNDLVKQEEHELQILKKYLPEQLSEDKIRKVVEDVVISLGDNANFGTVMGRAMSRLAGKADGKVVSQIVKSQTRKIKC